MNEQIESGFVNTYIQKKYRDRLLFELKDLSGKTHRRADAFKKFSHSAQDYVIPQLIAVSGNQLTEQDVLSCVEKMLTDKTTYYMDEWGGEELPLAQAVEKAFQNSGASIIVYRSVFSVIKEETESGAPTKLILVNHK